MEQEEVALSTTFWLMAADEDSEGFLVTRFAYHTVVLERYPANCFNNSMFQVWFIQ